jgi:hypothetical protein
VETSINTAAFAAISTGGFSASAAASGVAGGCSVVYGGVSAGSFAE